jgi:hypothetical protein
MTETLVVRNLTPLQEVRFVAPPTATPIALHIAFLPVFAAAEDGKLRADATAVIAADDGGRWAALDGWLRAPGEARVQCRRSGLTVALDARPDAAVGLLSPAAVPTEAAFVYVAADAAAKSLPLRATLDLAHRSLWLSLTFADNDAGHVLYDEVAAAMSNPAAKAAIELAYSCQYRVHVVRRRLPNIFTVDESVLRNAEVMRAQPEVIENPANKRFVKPALETFRMPVREVWHDPGQILIGHLPVVDPPPPPPPPPEIVETTFARTLRIDIFHVRDDATVYPDLPRLQHLGWGQVPGREGKTPLYFRDSSKVDAFFYLPSRFKLGFYTDGAATLPPMRAELYAGDGGEERVKVTLVALPDIADDERDAMRSYLRDVVLQRLAPFVGLTPAGGLRATFASDFAAGGSGVSQALPAGIRFGVADVLPDKRLVLSFDMPAMDYAIFCELLRRGLSGQVLLEDEGVHAGIPVVLSLDDVTTNALGLSHQGMEAGGTPALKVDNLLDLPLVLAALRVSLLDEGRLAGMVFDVEEQTLLTAQRFEAKTGTSAPLAPKRLSSWDETVITPPSLRVDGGSVDDWLDRVHRDPSLQPQTFHVQVQPVIPAAGAARVQLVELHLYRDDEAAPRLEPTLLPSAATFDLQVRMTLAELAGSAGAPPTFSLEFDTLYTDGGKSLPQRIAVDPTTRTLPILVLVESPGATYRVQHDGADEVLSREAAKTLIDQLKQTSGKHWQVFAIQPPAGTTGTGGTGTTGTTGTSGTSGTGGTGTTDAGGTGTTGTTGTSGSGGTGGTTPPPPGPQVSIVTDLLAGPFDSGKLLKVFVALQPLTAGAQSSTLQFDPANRAAATWQPTSGTIPPFAYKITYIFKDGGPKKVEGTEADLLLVLDPPA